MSTTERPLSPHLGIYRWPITMALSILHRATGIGLAVGLIALVAWLMSIAAGPERYLYFSSFMATTFGRILLIAWSFAFAYHLCNGIRHLFWDAGYGFEKSQANASAWVAIAASVILTATFWVMVL
ncbi:MAG: succinate dehydrogenase, cytochrome b556 subunit [Woeseiaceae bacterium]|nr:succinate dehydrogenase, cytochrome b556 subunit [Woeseiaceae bacterium]